MRTASAQPAGAVHQMSDGEDGEERPPVTAAVEGCRDYILGEDEEMEEVDYEADWRCSGRPCAKVTDHCIQHARTDSGSRLTMGLN